jgi:Ras-related protein Rap-1B
VNVDEVFVDLCRQMLRRDDVYDRSAEHDEYYTKHEDSQPGRKRRRRKRDQHRCVIL